MENPRKVFYLPPSPFDLFHFPFQTSGCILKRKRFFIALVEFGNAGLQQKYGLLLNFSKSSQISHASGFFPGSLGGR
jgi:hypothetical protein